MMIRLTIIRSSHVKWVPDPDPDESNREVVLANGCRGDVGTRSKSIKSRLRYRVDNCSEMLAIQVAVLNEAMQVP